MHHIRPLENPEYVSVTEWKFCQYLTTPHRKKKMLKRQIYNSQYMHYLKLSLLYSTKKIYIFWRYKKYTLCIYLQIFIRAYPYSEKQHPLFYSFNRKLKKLNILYKTTKCSDHINCLTLSDKSAQSRPPLLRRIIMMREQ